MKFRVKIKPEILAKIISGKKTVEYRQVESIVFTCSGTLEECPQTGKPCRAGSSDDCIVEYRVDGVHRPVYGAVKRVFQRHGIPYVNGLPEIEIVMGERIS